MPPFRIRMDSFLNSAPRLPIMQGSPPGLVPSRLDWDRAPWNRWSFQHIRELLPTAEVWRGAGPASPLPEAPQDFDALEVPLPGGGLGSFV